MITTGAPQSSIRCRTPRAAEIRATRVSARAALLHAKGELPIQEEIVIESILGTTFSVRVVETTSVGCDSAVIPEVGGRAWLTGTQSLVRRPDDPLRNGFLLR